MHIGLPKTGTTALQATAQARREDLLELGVRYPGRGRNHREAVSALMGRRWGWRGPGGEIPPMKRWDRLLSEVEAEHERRVWISHEFVSESDDETAKKFADAFGDSLHIAVTLRPFAAILASSWQQYLKGGTTHTFDHWLGAVLADPPKRTITPTFHRRNDQSAVIRRWASIVGEDKVNVIVVDKAQPTLLTDSFEQLFELPAGFLVDETLGGLRANRAMSMPESELLRALNLAIKGRSVHWRSYETLVRNGAIARVLEARTPGPDEDRMQLPKWAAMLANERGQRYAGEIGDLGVRIFGDLSALAKPAPYVEQPPPPTTEISLELAAESLAGLMSAALDRGAFFDDLPEPEAAAETQQEPPRTEVALSGIRTRQLAAVIAARIRRRVLRMIPRKSPEKSTN